MAVKVATRALRATPKAEHRRLKGISGNRARYDRRRRLSQHTAETVAMVPLLRYDPCILCQERPAVGEVQDVDHIVPLEQGGEDQWTNMAAACAPCNRGRKNTPVLIYMLRRRGRA